MASTSQIQGYGTSPFCISNFVLLVHTQITHHVPAPIIRIELVSEPEGAITTSTVNSCVKLEEWSNFTMPLSPFQEIRALVSVEHRI